MHHRGLCSFSHPELQDNNGQMLVFRSIHQLKRQLGDTKNVQLCNICVENRKACSDTFLPGPQCMLHSRALASTAMLHMQGNAHEEYMTLP